MEKSGLTANQIKFIALCAMTLDHLAAYGSAIPVLSKYSHFLRIIGRIAAPLFLFTLTESIHYTHNRTVFVLRLYFGAVGVGLFTAITNYFFGSSIGRFSGNNILFTYFYTALYVLLIELLKQSVENKNVKSSIICVLAIASTIIPNYISKYLRQTVVSTDWGWDLVNSLVVGALQVEYSILFIIMGVLMYFAPNKHCKVIVLAIFSLGCYYGDRFQTILLMISPDPYYADPQCWMILAVPIILAYNGEKGNAHKWFFYIYYPTHRYVIAVVEFIYVAVQSMQLQ